MERPGWLHRCEGIFSITVRSSTQPTIRSVPPRRRSSRIDDWLVRVFIGMPNVVAPDSTGGYHRTYLPKYLLSTDAELGASDGRFESTFTSALRRTLPALDTSSVTSVHVDRTVRVQPLKVLDYSASVPNVASRHRAPFVPNTMQFVDATRNNDGVVRSVDASHAEHAADLAGTPDPTSAV